MCWLPAGDAKMNGSMCLFCRKGLQRTGRGRGWGRQSCSGGPERCWGLGMEHIEVGQELDREELVYREVLDWPKSLFRFFLNSIQKNLN